MVWDGTVGRLDPATWAAIRLSYTERGATAGRELPPGYRHVRREEVVGCGIDAYAAVSEALLSWRLHRGAGLRVTATAPVAAEDVVVVSRLGAGPFGLTVPCRVVYQIDESDARGFAYGTLPGHPASGEESFCVRRHDDDSVTLAIVAFSRPARWFARLGGPVTRWLQQAVTSRYFAAARTAANGPR